MESSKRIFIGTVGYHLLRNHSVGPILLPQLKQMNWPSGVEVDELNWGPIAVVQQFQALAQPYDRVIILTAVNRENRNVGEVSVYQWEGGLPDEEQIQACVGDAATGVISVDNLLVIGEYFGIWPPELLIVDVEPGEEQAGEELTPELVAKVPDILALIKKMTEKELNGHLTLLQINGTQLFHSKKN